MSRVIAVAAPPGGGKTTLVRALAECLPDADCLFFDAYQHITERAPEDIERWMREGADFNAFALPRLEADLAALRRGEVVEPPDGGGPVGGRRHLLFEMPFGRAHAATAPAIDFLVWIDLPPDMALARKIHAFVHELDDAPADEQRAFTGWLDGYLSSYLSFVSDALAVQRRRIAADADLVLDGRDEPRRMARAVVDALPDGVR